MKTSGGSGRHVYFYFSGSPGSGSAALLPALKQGRYCYSFHEVTLRVSSGMEEGKENPLICAEEAPEGRYYPGEVVIWILDFHFTSTVVFLTVLILYCLHLRIHLH